MDSYTCFICTQTGKIGQFKDALGQGLSELKQMQPAVCGKAHLAVVTPWKQSSEWMNVDGVSVDDAVGQSTCAGGRKRSAALLAAISSCVNRLADRLPGYSVVLTLLWTFGESEPSPSSCGLLSALSRLVFWHGAVFSLLPLAGAVRGDMAVWRRLLQPSSDLQLRPTAKLHVHQSGDVRAAAGERLYFNCDADAWQEVRRRAAAVLQTDVTGLGQLAFCAERGLDVVGSVRLSSIPAHLIGPWNISIEFVDDDFAAWKNLLEYQDAAVLARVYLVLVSEGSVTSRSTKMWAKHLEELAAGVKAMETASVSQAFVLVNLIIRPVPEGFLKVQLLDDVPYDALSSNNAPLMGVDYVPKLDEDEWKAVTSSLGLSCEDAAGDSSAGDNMKQPRTLPINSCRESYRSPERTALSYWEQVHRAVPVNALGGVTSDSVMLDAAGILRAWRPPPSELKGSASSTADAGDQPQWLGQATETDWPAAAGLTCHGVYYNRSPSADARERRETRLRDRAVVHETASTCSVWRSDTFTVSTRRQPVAQRAVRPVRRSPRKRSLDSRPSTSVDASTSSGSSVSRRLSEGVRRPTSSSSAVAGPSTSRASASAVFRSPAKSVTGRTAASHLRRSPRKKSTPTPTKPRASSTSVELKQKLKKVIYLALNENAITTKHPQFQSYARKLYAIMRAYVSDSSAASSVTLKQLMKFSRLHVKHVLEFQGQLNDNR